MLLQPLQLKKLDALSLQARKAFTGASKGEKRSTKRGSSVEFADFRQYNAGDDIRRIDWNAYARFDKLYLKMFMEEEDLDLSLFIDASASMQFGEPPKLRAASQIAGALGYVGLANFDRVSASFFGEKLRSQMPPARGKGAVPQLFRFLDTQEAVGKADFSLVCKRAALQAKRSGIAVVISDFLFQDGYESGLKTLAARGFETTVIQLLSREELEPSMIGDFKLVDVEDKSIREISISSSLLRAYKKNLDDYTSNLRKFCLKFGMNYVLAPGDLPAEEIVGRMLRLAGVVK